LAGQLQKFIGLLILGLAVLVGGSYLPDRPQFALVSRWAPAPSDFIDIGGQQVHFRDEGPRNDPTPLLLLPDLDSSLHSWEGWASALRSRHRVISVDLPGLGLTGPAPKPAYSPADDVRFVLALMDALRLQRVVLGGHGLGGDIAWHTALAAPHRVAGLVLVDAEGYPSAAGMPLGSRLTQSPLMAWLTRWTLTRPLLEAALRQRYGDPTRLTATTVDRTHELLLLDGNRETRRQRLQQRSNGADAARIAQLSLPALIVWGGRDPLQPPSQARRFNTDLRGSRLVVFDDLGHLPQEEDPRRTAPAVQDFLSRLGR
jgi:pimeloyl-ACP methyl ester carboxylesterase